MTITRRLIALVTVPLVFTGGFAAWALTTTGREALSASRLMALVSAAEQAGVLADRLQQERTAATAVLLGGSPFEQLEHYLTVVRASDDEIAEYRLLRGELTAAPAGASVLLERIDDQLDRLPTVRKEIRESPTVALSAVTFAYRITIADLVSLREAVAQAEGGSAELVGQIRAASALSLGTEHAARLQVEVLQAIAAGGPVTAADQQAILAAGAGFREAMAAFGQLALPLWQDWLDHALTGPDVLTAQRLEDRAARAPTGVTLQIDPPQWTAATSARLALMHDVERRVDRSVQSELERVYAVQLRWLAAESAVVLVALMVAVALAIRQSRSMIRRLRGLSDAARAMAFVSLPEMVRKLNAMGSQTVDPEALVNEAAAPVPDVGADEIAEVSNAFLSVHRQAIVTAADLANTRAGMSQIFLHLARRNQRLVGVLIRELDGAERGEDDPDRLATLFRLDQLATRMGRYTDNLLVVGGQTASRVDARDVPLDTVLRAAQSKIEQYQRMRFAPVDDRLLVRGDAVHDLVNLLAELLDNATQFSPPTSAVEVDAGAFSGRVVIRVRDDGVGIPPSRLEQFNETFASPPTINVSSIRSMGLTVVAHIAAWYGIGVRLVSGRHDGTVAEIALPATVFRTPDQLPAGGVQPAWSVGLSQQATGLGAPPAVAPPPPVGPDPPIFVALAREFAGFFVDASESHRSDGSRQPGDWRGIADEGWAAAANAAKAATAARVARHTSAGLPRRPPMANLVPGAVADGPGGAGAVDHRDPTLVAASVAAFARGNAQSRAKHAPHLRPSDPQENR